MAELEGEQLLELLRKIGAELNDIRLKTEVISKDSSSHSNHFAESVQKTTKSLAEMDTTVGSLAKGLLGPIGLAAGLVAVAKGLETFAQGKVQMQAFATNTGFSIKNIEEMQQVMRRLGMTTQESNAVIAGIGGKLQNLVAFNTDSDLWKVLTRSEGGAILANNLRELAKAGKQMEAFELILKAFPIQTKEAQIALSQYVGLPKSIMQDYAEARARGIEIWSIDPEKAKEYHNMWVDMEISFTKNIFPSISNHAIKTFTDMTNAFAQGGITQRSLADWLNVGTDEVIKTLATTAQEIKGIIDLYDNIRTRWNKMKERKAPLHAAIDESVTKTLAERYGTESNDIKADMDTKKDSNQTIQDTRSILQRMWEKGRGLIGRAEGGPVEAGKQYRVGERAAEIFRAGGKYKLVGEGGPEIIRPEVSGEIMTAGQLGMGIALKRLAPGIAGHALSVMSVDADTDNSWRSFARSKLGINDPGEPAPWKPGGLWREVNRADAQFMSQQTLEDAKWNTAMWKMSSQIAPQGLGWENWRRSSNVEDDTHAVAEAEMQTGGGEGGQITLRGTPVRAHGNLASDLGYSDVDRQKVDRSLANDVSSRSSLDGEINFLNVPEGIKTSVDNDGFDKFKVNKTRQLQLGVQ